MPDESRRDPFKPAPPAIPGVPAETTARKPAPPPRPRPTPAVARPVEPPSAPQGSQAAALAICLIAFVLLVGGGIVWKMRQPSAPVENAAAQPSATDELSVPEKLPANLPVAPGAIATADELSKPWSSKNFLFRNGVLGRTEPAMVVRLPQGGYWGFSLVEPFGNCKLEYVTDLDRLATTYNFQADHPMVADPCNHSVFDLLQYGGSSNAQVRGALVHGMGVRPPIAIEIEQSGKEIRAIRIE